MKLVRLAKKIYNEVDSAKRVGSCSFTLDELKEFLNFIDYVNNEVGDYTSSIDPTVDGEHFKVPHELAGLFYPSRVILNPEVDRSCLNLIAKESKPETDGVKPSINYDYGKFVQFCNKLYGTFRKVPAFTDSIVELRKVVTLTNYLGDTAYANGVRGNYTQTSIPCPLIYKFYDEYVYNMPIDDYIIIAIRNIISSLAK